MYLCSGKTFQSMRSTSFTREVISKISVACRYWELARKHASSNRASAGGYYARAYSIFQREMGADNLTTLELRKEMAEFLSRQAVMETAVCCTRHF